MLTLHWDKRTFPCSALASRPRHLSGRWSKRRVCRRRREKKKRLDKELEDQAKVPLIRPRAVGQVRQDVRFRWLWARP